MKGDYNIRVADNKIEYLLKIKRNITVILGNSGTGKSYLWYMIRSYNKNPASGIIVQSNAPIYAVSHEDIDYDLYKIKAGTICLLDEDGIAYARRTQKLRDLLLRKDFYFILIGRSDMKELPYSISEIYEMKGKLVKIQNKEIVRNTLSNVDLDSNVNFSSDSIITEDSNFGSDEAVMSTLAISEG